MVTIEEVIRVKYKFSKRYIDIYVDRVEMYNGKGRLIDAFYMYEVELITYNIKFGFKDLFIILFASRTATPGDFGRVFKKVLMFDLKRKNNKSRGFRVSKDEYERISKLIPLDIKII